MTLRETIFCGLDNVKEDGYFDPEKTILVDCMLYWTDLQIAEDMIAYYNKLSQYEPTALVPFIREWRELNQCLQPATEGRLGNSTEGPDSCSQPTLDTQNETSNELKSTS